VGGGKAMAPKARDYFYRPPRKVRQGALRVALSLKARDKKLFILDAFPVPEAKTKAVFQLLTKRLKLTNALVVDEKGNDKLHRSIRNMAKFDAVPPEGLNLESLLRHEALVLTSKAAKALEGALS
jgi:large subunit ribosomal protein L4